MNTRRGRGRPPAAASSSSTVKPKPPVKPRRNRRNGLHNITNTKSDESNSDLTAGEPISVDSTDEGEQETVVDQPSATEKQTKKRLHSPTLVPATPARKRVSKSADVGAVSSELALYNAVRETLSKHYFDVVARLQLNFQPNCISNLEYCSTFHNKDGVWPGIYIIFFFCFVFIVFVFSGCIKRN